MGSGLTLFLKYSQTGFFLLTSAGKCPRILWR